MILSGIWAGLTPCEKALLLVLGVKAKVNDPEALDFGFHAMGNIYEANKYIKWAGISRSSFYTAFPGLNHKNLIEFWEYEDTYRYGIYALQQLNLEESNFMFLKIMAKNRGKSYLIG